MIHTLLDLDTEVLIWARWLLTDAYAPLLQISGESIVIFVALFLIGLWLYGVSQKDNAYKIIALQIFTTIILTFIVYTILNFGIEKWRPSPQEVVWWLPPLIPHPLDNSFPSGHALFTVAFLIGCVRFFYRSWVIGVCILLGIITAVSRIMGGIHYPGDIVGWWILWSIGAAIIVHLVDTWFFRIHIFAHLVRIAAFFRL